MRLPLTVLLLTLTAQLAATAQAGVNGIDAFQVAKPAAILPGFTTTDIVLDFTGNLRGQQLILELTQGSIYQHPLGSNTAPNSALFPIFPEVEYDTYITIGGRSSEMSQPVLPVGGAVDLQPGSGQKFDTEGLNVAWAPGTGVDIPSGTDFITARITLSNDAIGFLRYFASTGAGTGDPLVRDLPINFGCICFVDSGPIVNDYFFQVSPPITTVSATITSEGTEPDSWSELLDFTYTPDFGAPPNSGLNLEPDWNPATQEFVWDTTGSSPGVYSWQVEATNSFGSDRGLINVVVFVPEPAAATLFALGLVAWPGVYRKRR